MVFSLLLRCVSTVVGAFFPAFYTFKTLARPNQRAQIYWLKYWAVFGAALAVEFVLDSLFITYLIPGYELARLLFIIYSVNPVTNGAQSLYDNLLKPLLFKHQPQIDAVKTNVTAAIMDRASGVATNVGHMLFSATINRVVTFPGVSTIIQLAAPPVMPQRTHAYNLRMDNDEDEIYPIIREIKEEPLDWDDEEGEVQVLSVKESRTRNTRKTHPVIEIEEEEEREKSDAEMNSGDEIEYIPPPKKGGSSARGKGRGRGRGKKN